MKTFHPLTFWALFSTLATGVVISNSVMAALLAIAGAALLVILLREEGPWAESFKWALIAGGILIIIRAITGVLIGVPRVGTTLFTLPRINLPDWMPGIRIGGAVTWERLSSSLHEGLIIATVIALFGAANSLTSPHKLLRVLPTGFYQIGVTLTIATSVFPQLMTSAKRIRDAQFLRSGSRPKLWQISIPLLEESLERAVNLAESMEARGFGSSRRTSRYRRITYSARDFAYIALGFMALLAMVSL